MKRKGKKGKWESPNIQVRRQRIKQHNRRLQEHKAILAGLHVETSEQRSEREFETSETVLEGG